MKFNFGLISAIGVIFLLTFAWMMAVERIDARPWARRLLTWNWNPREQISEEPVVITDHAPWAYFVVGATMIVFSIEKKKPEK